MGAWLAFSRPASLRLSPADAAKATGVGAIIALHWICFFAAIQLANVSVALVGYAATSVFTALTEPLIDRRPVRPSEILLGLVVAAGLVLIVGFEHSQILGLAVALLCALFAAIFPVLNHRLVNRGLSSRTLLVYEMSGAALVTLGIIAILPPVVFQSPRATDWLPLLTLALACTVFAHSLHIHLLRKLSAYTSNLACNFEPVYGIILAAAIFQEHQELHPGFYLGALTIVAANIIQPILERRRRNKAATPSP
jgi:drug/metabolite transporter (DMT)-like permease